MASFCRHKRLTGFRKFFDGNSSGVKKSSPYPNGEILFALEQAGLEAPPFIEDVKGGKRGTLPGGKERKICLVDHSEVKQMPLLLRDDPKWSERVIGVIDHHALAGSFVTSKPLFMDLRPWGSMSSIVAVLFLQHKKHLPSSIAKMLLMAVLSDTLNLQSVTTTAADTQIVALLSSYGMVSSPEDLAYSLYYKKNRTHVYVFY